MEFNYVTEREFDKCWTYVARQLISVLYCTNWEVCATIHGCVIRK